MLRIALRPKSPLKKASIAVPTKSLLKITNSVRFISKTPDEIFTKLSEENDPQRDAFFKYSWGSWLVNDNHEKAKRTTRFSIEGLNDVLNGIYTQSKENAQQFDESHVPAPIDNSNRTVSLPHNVSIKNLGTVNPNENIRVTAMASIHEGKHHRIYKVDTNAGKSFVLRIPYALENEKTISYRINSEVATMDFVDLKLGLKVPKVFCYASEASNPIRQPFILQEYVDGRLLMRDWNPLEDDAEDKESHVKKLNSVIEPLSKMQAKMSEIEFTQFGSLYFAKDCEVSELPAYQNESNEDLQKRWQVGPTTERCFWRKKSALKFEELKRYIGPWPLSQPMDIIKNTGLVEAENAKARLALKEAGASPETVDKTVLSEQVRTFDNIARISTALFNTNTSAIPNIKDLLKPRLYHPDLDPMNVLLSVKDENAPYLLDFEGACIKPFILQNSPQFVAYDGPKIYNLEEDIEGYKDMSNEEKMQYQFMYKRTRNQFLWESALNKNSNNLISSVAPPVKLLRSPYIACVERKSDMEYLLIDEALIQLREVWDVFAKNGLVSEKSFPLEFSKEQLEKHAKDLTAFHEKLISSPFAATQGWIPQDMFDNLVKSQILVKGEDGNYALNTANV
ncbi:LAFE_0B04324g1_1 [Lachancea fermentati]|uniref:Altered inheritance of mitochondria protein 9, mitochondrial n=1 Tax=Lachancea fermentati TaxID=4955 RepID=A0A1G4M7Q1_LACFM|nr:LAFE_0B04324g1_1 [Lachancea fermentati]